MAYNRFFNFFRCDLFNSSSFLSNRLLGNRLLSGSFCWLLLTHLLRCRTLNLCPFFPTRLFDSTFKGIFLHTGLICGRLFIGR